MHVWEQGDTLPKLSKKYKVTVAELTKWNVIKSTAKLYAGLRIIVQKGDPTKPSEAEQEEMDRKARERRKIDQAGIGGKVLEVDEGKAFRNDGKTMAEQMARPCV